MTHSAQYVYILECSDHTFYTGWTTNPKKRVETHNQGKGAKYTRGRLPVKLVYSEKCADKSEALRREVEIKKWPRLKKMSLVKGELEE